MNDGRMVDLFELFLRTKSRDGLLLLHDGMTASLLFETENDNKSRKRLINTLSNLGETKSDTKSQVKRMAES